MDAHNYPLLHIGLVYLIWKVVEYITSKKENEPEDEEMRLVPDLTSQTEYFVNGRKVSVGLTYYYLGLLRLFGEKEITESIIRHSYMRRFNEMKEKKVGHIEAIDDEDIRAAKLYMLDRWNYMAFMN